MEATSTYHVLLVCTGNTCRSPMAEAIAVSMFAGRPELKDRLEVGSAGVYATDGAPASEQAVEVMAQRGLNLGQHRSRLLTADMVAQADGIYTMTQAHRRAVVAAFPEAELKTQRLLPEADISDPIGGPVAAYQSTAEQIELGLKQRFTEDPP